MRSGENLLIFKKVRYILFVRRLSSGIFSWGKIEPANIDFLARKIKYCLTNQIVGIIYIAKEVKIMKKIFILFLTICLFSFTLFAADVDLSSNLTFTFEPSCTTEKSLTIIPFTNQAFNVEQINEIEKNVEVKKDNSWVIIFAFGVALTAVFCLETEF